METILVTGGAGFIGSHVAEALLDTGHYRVICLDNLDEFYPRELKEDNLATLNGYAGFRFICADISHTEAARLEELLSAEQVTQIIHLAAKAGVRPSIQSPAAYYQTNVTGTVNILEFARHSGVRHVVYASSSSVYGNGTTEPAAESRPLVPISPYAATKIAGEQLGHLYQQLHGVPFTALRLFTVYGPRQRPDLAVHKFYNLMKQDREILLYGDGSTSRDYTFVGDLVKGILAAVEHGPADGFSVFNLGSGRPVSLLAMVRTLEEVTGTLARVRFTGEQPGDVSHTWADISRASQQLHYRPATSLEDGIRAFISWKENHPSIVY